MKKVIKDYSQIPAKLTSVKCAEKVEDAMLNKGNHSFDNNTYAHKTVKKKLESIYNNKCAFCENDTTAGAALQVEHYRPKAKIKEDSSHEGYYWLGYEWSNLLYACSKCNRAKGTQFPIENGGQRVYVPTFDTNNKLDSSKCQCNDDPLINEKPMLLNPELDDPSKHLCYSVNGKIRGLDKRGEESIRICKLYRNPLVIARKKCYSNIFEKIKKVISDLENRTITSETAFYKIVEDINSDVIKKINQDESFSEFYKSMLKNREAFFVFRFSKDSQKNLIRQSFNRSLGFSK